MTLTRREFVEHLGRTAGSGLVIGFDPRRLSWVTAAERGGSQLLDLPELAGVLLDDESSREGAADDRGHIVHMRPRAVLRPGSVRDIALMVRYANEHGLKVAMRGQGHSHYGHAQVENGIVIDSSTLRRVEAPAGRLLEAEAGASWGDVADVAVAAGLTPPVMPDVMALSVGGTLSVGGLGATSQRFGAQVDNVEEIEVVTGDGRVVRCSGRRERELFEMALAGIGQCGLIVRARLRLVPAPATVSLGELYYDDLADFLRDHEQLARDGRFAHQYGWVERLDEGRWRMVIQVGEFDTPRASAGSISDLRFASKSAPSTMNYRQYLDRLAAFVAQARQRPDWTHPRPSTTMFVPAAAARDFIARILRTPDDTAGIWRFDICPFNTNRLTRPLLRMPAGTMAFSLWMFRIAPADNPEALHRMLTTVNSLVVRLREVGGTPYAPYFIGSPDAWRWALGAWLWRRLSAAKRRFDPKGVLTPGPCVFEGEPALSFR